MASLFAKQMRLPLQEQRILLLVLPFIYTTVKNYTIKCNRIQVAQYTKKRVSFEILLKNFTKETPFLLSISDLPVPYSRNVL